MNRHPGGEEHTRRMLDLAALPEGAKLLDLGAGAGESVALMRALGYDAAGNLLSSQEVAALVGGDEGCGLTSALSPRVARVYKEME